MLALLKLSLALAGLAVVWSSVLVKPDGLLEPAQRAWRNWYRDRYLAELDNAWWWKPLWGCPWCTAGQWAFWAYLLRFHASYSLLEHLTFTAYTILAACLLTKWTN